MIFAGKRYFLYPRTGDRLRLWSIADVHLWERDCSVNLFRSHVGEIRDDPYSWWQGNGDYCSYIGIRDKRFDATMYGTNLSVPQLGSLGKVQVDGILAELSPIKAKCTGAGFGNHEYYLMNAQDQTDLHAYLCRSLDVPNLGYSCYVDWVFIRASHLRKPEMHIGALPACYQTTQGSNRLGNRWTVRVFQHHGVGGATTLTGKANRLARWMEQQDADVYLLAHVHGTTTLYVPRNGANAACTDAHATMRVATITGSYLRVYGNDAMPSWGERMGLPPAVLGACVVNLHPATHEIYVEGKATVEGR